VTAIYQRSRPIHWDEVVGQEHVKDVLRPALERGRIGHAYLFSGPRGVGKTTTARLIAMTVNCETPGVKPCGSCDSCKSVIAGRHPDVLEIDAASNNSVDDVRDLREKVALQPMRGDKKVYILDEAHMMSKSAFNALLKTLEEPPSHAVFILATTEPERLPATILSRCQHYRFRRLSSDEIAGKLLKTATAEGVNPSPQALNLIARAADGAMRDGESLLERLLASGEPNLTLEMVEGALGLPPQDRVEALAFALARGDTKRLMQFLTAFYSDGFAPRTIVERVKIALRDQLHAQLGLSKNVSETFSEVDLLRLIRALDEEDARFARASDLIALEMAFTKAMLAPDSNAESGSVSPALESRVANLEKQVRGAFQKVVDEGLKASGQRVPSLPEFDPTARAPRRPTPVATVQDDDPPFELQAPQTQAPPPPREPPLPRTAVAAPLGSKGWADVILKADLRLRAILKEAVGHLSADTLIIEYSSPKHKWHAEQVAAKLEELATLTQQVIGQGIALELVMPDGTKKNSRSQNSISSTQPAARVVTAVLEQLPVPVLEQVVPALEQLPVPTLEPESAPTLEPESAQKLPDSIVPKSEKPAPVKSLSDPDEPDFLPPEMYAPLIETHASKPPVTQSPKLEPLPPADSRSAQNFASDLAFDALGSNSAKAGLFTPAEFVAALEPGVVPLLEPESTMLILEPENTVLLEPEPIFEDASALYDDAPLPTEYGSLETFDLSVAADAAPLAALEMDFGDLDKMVAPKKIVSSLAGHPNYALLSKLFSHRVREIGLLEVKVPIVENDDIVATIALPTDDLE
jgi:DNA polymerase III subunit gamma/tau